MSFILMFVLSACGSEPESEAENAHEISVTVSVTMHPTEPAISDKSTEIGEPENKSDTDNTDVNTPDNTDKISIELKEKANSNELLDVDIRFGNPWIESLKNLQEQYPDEYSAYLLVKNADGDVAIDDETTRLAEACMELKTKLPSSWLRKQAEVLFQKYPELRECEVADCGNDIFVVHIAYSTVLLLAEEPSITALFPYIDYESVRKPRVVGETNGNKIYDVTLCSGIGWDAKVPAGGDLVFYIDTQSFNEAADNDYFKTAFILEPDEISCLDSLKKLSGIDSYNWFRWLSSEEGMSAAYEAELSYTDKGYRFLQNYGWTILEEGRSEAIKHCCKAGLATRYIIVLASKKQLMELFPGLNSMSVDNYNYVPDRQKIDSSCCLYVYCAGVVHTALEESQ